MSYPSLQLARRFLVLAMAFSTLACASAISNEYRSLKIDGELFASACSRDPKSVLYDTLLSSNVQDTDKAWRAIELILCSPNNATNRKFIKSIVPERIERTSVSTGDISAHRLIARSDALISALPAAGEAWNAEIRAVPGTIVLQYFSNAACVKERTFTYVRSRWLLSSISEACD